MNTEIRRRFMACVRPLVVIRTRWLGFLLGVSVSLLVGGCAATGVSDEVFDELSSINSRVTPFVVRYDRTTNMLIYRETVQDAGGTAVPRDAEAQLNLANLDPKRIDYQSATGFNVLIKGRLIVGQVRFFCLEGKRCIRRGFVSTQSGRLEAEESDETVFRLDVFEGTVINDLVHYSSLVQQLIARASVGDK
jgi:hypothetical protein